MKLISMTDYVFYQDEINGGLGEEELDNIWNYAKFLKQPLNIGMFVPAIEENGFWSILEEPLNFYLWLDKSINTEYDSDLSKYKQFEQALNNILFNGFEVKTATINKVITDRFYGCNIFWECGDKWVLSKKYKTIEDLVKYDLTLTENAIKKL